jgi:glutathione S-transferase
LNQLTAIISLQGYVASENLTFADIVAASHLAVLDYFQDINWQQYPKIKSWYCLIKSRPAFRSTLQEKIKTLDPPKHYLELDF